MCSALVPLSARGGSLAWPLGVLGALMAALVVWLSLCEWRHAPSPRAANDAAPPMRVREIVRTWLTTPYAVLMGCFAFLSAGVEASTGGWVATYAQRFEGASRAMWALMPMGFYGGMLAGRGFAPVFLRLLSPRRLIFTGLAVAMVGLGIILGSSNLGGVLAGVCVAGLGLSTLFPTTFAYFTRYFGTRSSSMVGGVFVLTSLGSACLPWAVGFVSSRTGRLGWGLAGTLVATLAMTIVQVAIFRILAHAERS
jgi:fucose permease